MKTAEMSKGDPRWRVIDGGEIAEQPPGPGRSSQRRPGQAVFQLASPQPGFSPLGGTAAGKTRLVVHAVSSFCPYQLGRGVGKGV